MLSIFSCRIHFTKQVCILLQGVDASNKYVSPLSPYCTAGHYLQELMPQLDHEINTMPMTLKSPWMPGKGFPVL